MPHPFEKFLKEFVPAVERKSTQLNKAYWLLETSGSQDAADLKADLDTELRFLFNDPTTYKSLQDWDKDPSLKDPVLRRQLNVLIRAFKQNQIPKELLEEMAQKEAALAQSYVAGVPVDWRRVYGEHPPRPVSLPTYPFQRERYWFELAAGSGGS